VTGPSNKKSAATPAAAATKPQTKAPSTKSAEESDTVVRRTRRSPFVPPSGQADGPAVSRELLSRGAIGKPQMSRNRKIAGDLPDWDPLPPGEITVLRPNGSRTQ
jgi:hypothetical protein